MRHCGKRIRRYDYDPCFSHESKPYQSSGAIYIYIYVAEYSVLHVISLLSANDEAPADWTSERKRTRRLFPVTAPRRVFLHFLETQPSIEVRSHGVSSLSFTCTALTPIRRILMLHEPCVVGGFIGYGAKEVL